MTAGLEPAAAAEVSSAGFGTPVLGRGWVRLRAVPAEALRAVLTLRSAPRVTWELARALPADTPEALREAAAALPWERWLPHEAPWAVRAIGTNDALRHTLFTARLLKDAVRDRYAARGLNAPPVDPQEPEITVTAHLERDGMALGIDLAGASLHLRGSGRRGPAPLREDIAAGLALLAGIGPGVPLCDPFCGTGTLVAEAAAIALGLPPRRDPSRMPLRLLAPFRGLDLAPRRASARALAPIVAADRDRRVLDEARRTFAAQGLTRFIEVRCGDVTAFEPPVAPGVLLSNPPWGLRLDDAEARAAWEGLGHLAHRRLPGWTLGLICGTPGLTRALGLRAERKYPVSVGGVDTRFLVYRVRDAAPAR